MPLSTVFDAFPRAVRDIARQQGKEVDLNIENSGVGVDRSMLNDVRDALIHLIRNAVDHGLETAELRTALGKPAVGRLTIRVRADGDMLHLEVEDDGRGMDPEQLKASALSKKILTAAQAAALSEREAIELIFLPGFSTRDEVSDISGRGVGMDVVKRKVEALGGSVSVVSRLGRGTHDLAAPAAVARADAGAARPARRRRLRDARGRRRGGDAGEAAGPLRGLRHPRGQAPGQADRARRARAAARAQRRPPLRSPSGGGRAPRRGPRRPRGRRLRRRARGRGEALRRRLPRRAPRSSPAPPRSRTGASRCCCTCPT